MSQETNKPDDAADEGGLVATATDSLEHVDADAWNALAGEHHPFTEHGFLRLLETSKSVAGRSGWTPLYVLVHRGDELVGACPTYVKMHSYGEYIFDWGWANAAAQVGIDYYPKLVVGVPFTPATGPRLLTKSGLSDEERLEIWDILAGSLLGLMEQVGASSVHVLFCLDDEATFLAERGFFRRATHQFHWRNGTPAYENFDGFLGQLRNSARKAIRKERRKVAESGLDIARVKAWDFPADELSTLYRLYRSTTDRKYGEAYLKRAFFEGLHGDGGEHALITTARRDGELVAMTLSFEKGEHVYGRYWGAFEAADNLHFELCYYQLIDHALEKGLSLVEAGAQGQHKIKRGYLPVVIHSAHAIAHPGMHQAIAQAMDEERRGLEQELEAFADDGPFKAGCAPDLPPRAGIPLPSPAKASTDTE